jgi:uncharacterized BrkB/YihY/UPF0761 family membrane protein
MSTAPRGSRWEGPNRAARAELARLQERLEAHAAGLFLVRCVQIYYVIEARDRVLMLAGQGFIALIPLLMVVATFASASGVAGVGVIIIDGMDLTGGAADAVTSLFAYPPGATGGITAFSIVLLLFSLNSFAKSVQRTFEAAWGLPRMGMRGVSSRTAGLIALLGGGVLAAWIGHDLDPDPVLMVVVIIVQLVVIAAAWLIGTSLMLARRTPFRLLMVGALVSAALQLVVGWATAIYMPAIFARNAERYGVIGVALALVTWLIAVTSVVVGGAIIRAILCNGGGGALKPAPVRSS